MDYKVKIDPKKEREFIQLLRTWQQLRVIESFSVLQGEEASDKSVQLTGKNDSTNDIVRQYRDLVD